MNAYSSRQRIKIFRTQNENSGESDGIWRDPPASHKTVDRHCDCSTARRDTGYIRGSGPLLKECGTVLCSAARQRAAGGVDTTRERTSGWFTIRLSVRGAMLNLVSHVSSCNTTKTQPSSTFPRLHSHLSSPASVPACRLSSTTRWPARVSKIRAGRVAL